MSFIRKQTNLVKVVVICALVTIFTQTAQAKSVYAIINHPSDIIGAYKIQGDQIEYQTEIQAPEHGYRAIDLAIDSDSCCLFVTYEQSNLIEIMNAKTLQNVGSVTAIGASDLAGIVFDEAKQKLYVVDRQSNKLFAYLWNAASKTLTADGTNPKILTDIYEPYGDGAYGIALDTVNGHLYVTNYTSTIHYYDTNDWSHLDSNDIVEIAVDVDIDPSRGYLYAGGYTAHTSLLKLDLSSGITESNDIGAGVIGLAVDPDTGLVYTTTYHNQLRVYDTSTSPFTLTDSENISAGCGVCVPSGDVSYKARFPYLTLVKDDNDVDCAYPYNFIDENYLVYHINYDANGYSGGAAVITDYLPFDVNYHSSDPCGAYDPCLHTVSWNVGSISPSDSNAFEILTEVTCYARPGSTIHNICEIESDQYYSFAIIDTNVCCYCAGNIIYVDKDANGCNNGTSWEDAYTLLQDGFTGARNCPGVKAIWVAEGTYKPVWETDASDAYKDESFELIDGVGVFGHFAGYEWSTSQRDFADANNETILQGQIGGEDYEAVTNIVTGDSIDDSILDGFTVTGSYSSYYGSYDGSGIFLDYSDVGIANCKVKDNTKYGVYAVRRAIRER